MTSSRYRLTRMSTFAGLLGVGAVLATSSARSEPPKPSIGALPIGAARMEIHATCGAVAADATLTFGANVPLVSQSSPSSSYNHGDTCQAYVVDFRLTEATSKAPGGNDPAVSFAASNSAEAAMAGATEATCGTYVQRVTLYRKRQGETVFTTVGGGLMHGVWIPARRPTQQPSFGNPNAHCEAKPEPGFKDLPTSVQPPAAGSVAIDTYRVATSASLNGTFRLVTASSKHLPTPPG